MKRTERTFLPENFTSYPGAKRHHGEAEGISGEPPGFATTQVAMLSGASNFRVQGSTFMAAARDIVINHYNKDNIDMLKEKLNPIMNPVKKQVHCMEGTRIRILNDLCQWTLSRDSHMAWIHGLAGSGKSAIAVSLAEKLREMKDQVTLALTFHCVKGQETSNTSLLVPTICFHLAKVYPQYATDLLQVFQKDVSLHADSIPLREQLSEFFKPLHAITAQKPTVIIIDGLDEWGTPMEQYALLNQLQVHLGWIKWIRVVVTSRLNDEIQMAMMSNWLVRSFDLTIDYTAHYDIQIFFWKRFHSLNNQGISASQVHNLISKADGLFIWAKTALEFIESGMDMLKNVQVVLQMKNHGGEMYNPHATLFNLYGELMKQYFTSKQSQQLFQIVVGSIVSAYEPLAIDTLAKMLSLQFDITYHVVNRVVNVLKAVLYQHNGKVYYHLSLAEFLSSQQCPSEFKIQKSFHHQILARICVEVLSRELKFNMCKLETSSILNRDILDLEERIFRNISSQLQYSAVWWAHHIEYGYDDTILINAVASIAASPCLMFWIECMSLLGRANTMKLCIEKLKLWAFKIKKLQLKKIMEELERFLVTFYIPIYESTPHIYITGCTFMPQRSLLKENKNILSRNAAQFISISGQEVQWGKELLAIKTENNISSIAYSPDGRYIASGFTDGTVGIWDTQTGQQSYKSLGYHAYAVNIITFSPDGQYILSGSFDQAVKNTGIEHPDHPSEDSHSAEGHYILSRNSDQTVRVWNTQTGQQVGNALKLKTDTDWVCSAVAFSSDAQHIVCGYSDGTVRIVNTQTGVEIYEPGLKGHSAAVCSVAYSPNGQYVVSGSKDQTLRIWNTQTKQQVGEPLWGHTGWIVFVAYSSNGQNIVSGDGRVRVWDTQTRQQKLTIAYPYGTFEVVKCSLDGQYIAFVSFDGTLKVWNFQKQVEEEFYGHTDLVNNVTFSSDGQYMASASRDGTLRIWRTGTGDLHNGHIDRVSSVAYSPDSQYIVSGSDDNTVRIWNAQTGQQVWEIKGHTNRVWSVAYSPNGQYVVSGSADKTARIWNVRTGKQIGWSFEGHTDSVRSVAFSPNGQYIVSGSHDRTVRIWNVQTGQQVGLPLTGHANWVFSVAYLVDGQYVISGSHDRRMRIWNSQSRQLVREWDPLKGQTNLISVAYSPDGKYVACGSADDTATIWDLQMGQQVLELHDKGNDRFESIAFSPDGQHLVSGAYGMTIQIWSALTGYKVGKPLQGRADRIDSVAYSPDGQYVVSGSSDNTIRIWDIPRGQQNEPMTGYTQGVINLEAHLKGKNYRISGLEVGIVRGDGWQTSQPYDLPPLPSTRTQRLLRGAIQQDAIDALMGSRPLNNYQHFPIPVQLPSTGFITQSDCNVCLPPGIASGYINENGWLCSEDGQLIIWIPSWMRAGFRDKRQTLTIPADGPDCAISVDWKNFAYGTQWTKCWAQYE